MEAPGASSDLTLAGFSERVAFLLARRGITDPARAAEFLHPSLEQLHAPQLLLGMAEAVERLLAACRAGEAVALVGDYDVDGVSGTALLVAVLRACAFEVHPILPHRMLDGYGFQPVHVERARKLGAKVVVTIDCGTSSHEAANAAKAEGIDVIVTDHHLPGSPLPSGVIQINPRQESCSYPFDDLSGAGLAFKLGLAVAEASGRKIDPKILLRIACLGTIADLVPLHGENRTIASVGLAELSRTRSPGLRALIEVSGARPPYSAADVGFRLGPRLNAPGRLYSAQKALDLLLCRDPETARELATELDQTNRERQEAEKKVVREAREALRQKQDLPPILVAWSQDWHRGVVGVAAGRLAREFNRPTILLGVEDDLATGSGRTAAGIHLHGFLDQWSSSMERFGGHAQAIGLTIATSRLEALREAWQEAAETWRERVALRRIEYELEIEADELSSELVSELAQLEPFGQGNPQPLLRIRGPLRLNWQPRFFGRGHLSADACGSNGSRIPLLGWGWQEKSALLEGEFEVLGYLERDRYRGRVLRLVEARPCEPNQPGESSQNASVESSI